MKQATSNTTTRTLRGLTMQLLAAQLLTAATLAFSPVEAFAIPAAFPVDTGASTIVWTGKKVTGQHSGNVAIKSGSALIEGDTLVGGQFVIDLSAISVSDIPPGKDNAKLVGHLKSDDFFGVDAHPEATFTIKSATLLGAGEGNSKKYNIKGDLVVKGVTSPIEFPAHVTIGKGFASAKAVASVDRTKFGIRYGSGSFFENLGDKMIYDSFEVAIDLKTVALK